VNGVVILDVRPAAISPNILLVGIVGNSIVIFRNQQARTSGRSPARPLGPDRSTR
jgi:hypothetical protein